MAKKCGAASRRSLRGPRRAAGRSCADGLEALRGPLRRRGSDTRAVRRSGRSGARRRPTGEACGRTAKATGGAAAEASRPCAGHSAGGGAILALRGGPTTAGRAELRRRPTGPAGRAHREGAGPGAAASRRPATAKACASLRLRPAPLWLRPRGRRPSAGRSCGGGLEALRGPQRGRPCDTRAPRRAGRSGARRRPTGEACGRSRRAHREGGRAELRPRGPARAAATQG